VVKVLEGSRERRTEDGCGVQLLLAGARSLLAGEPAVAPGACIIEFAARPTTDTLPASFEEEDLEGEGRYMRRD
jgi:hypothetical protein